MVDGQIVQSSAQEQEQLLREMLDLLSVLEETKAQTQQRLSALEVGDAFEIIHVAHAPPVMYKFVC
jgi:hypothetical protein